MPSEVPSAGRFLAGVALPAGAAATSQDPVDIATMFAKLRNVLPIGLAAYTPELNKGEAEWIAQRNRERDWEEAQRTNRRELTPEEQVRNFEWQYPGTIERQLMLEYLRRQQEKQLPGPRRAPSAPPAAQHEARAIEPRRKADGGSVKQSASSVNPPEGAQEFIDAIRKKFASGGAVGIETTPDMSDGGNVIPVPEVGMAGGGDPGKKLKSVASMFKTLEKEPDLARRALFKLPESANLPAAIEKRSLPGMKDAPKVTEKTVELDPGEGKKKVTVKSLAETPVSRREVLQSAASQVARRALPDILSADAARIVPEELFKGTSDWPSVYRAMLPMVMKHAPQELETLPSRVGVKLEDLLRISEEDPFVRSMSENLTRFKELFPLTFKKTLGDVGGGVAKPAASGPDIAAAAPPRVVYHAGADFETPNPGLFTTPDLEAAEKFLRNFGGSKLHTFLAQPRQSGTGKDVEEVARLMGIYDPKVPVGQYLEQGENAVFGEAPAIVRKLREKGLDSVVIDDGMSSAPSLVVLDPAVLTRATGTKPKGKAAGGSVDTSNMPQMVSNAMANGLSEPEAIKMLAPIFMK